MVSYELEFKVQSLLFVAEAVVYLALAIWCLNRRREGQWSLIAALGSAVVGVVLGLVAVAGAESVFLEPTRIYDDVLFHEHLGTVLTVARVLGVALLAYAFVLSRRTPPAPTNSIYGA